MQQAERERLYRFSGRYEGQAASFKILILSGRFQFLIRLTKGFALEIPARSIPGGIRNSALRSGIWKPGVRSQKMNLRIKESGINIMPIGFKLGTLNWEPAFLNYFSIGF